MDDLTPEERAWCAGRIAERVGRPLALTSVEPVPSRLAGVWRLRAAELSAAFYLKRYPSHEPRYTSLADHFALLGEIASVVETTPDLFPYRAFACLPEKRVILSEETPGSPIAWLHRDLPRSAAVRRAAERAWAGVGAWLASLHGLERCGAASADMEARARHARELADYTRERLERWAIADPSHAALARAAIASARDAAGALALAPPPLVPCHGDVSTQNILAGDRIGLIDFDDLRLDFAATDLSLVLLEIAQFSRIGSLVPLPGLKGRFRRAFRARYTRPWPEGAAFRLPHLRNLAVFALTLAECRGPLSLSQLTTRAHYRTTVAELRRTIAAG